MRCELVHAAFFAIDKERTPCAGLLLPSQQFSLAGMGGEAVDGVNARIDWNLFAENSHLFGAIDDATRESAGGRVANEHDGRLGTA